MPLAPGRYAAPLTATLAGTAMVASLGLAVPATAQPRPEDKGITTYIVQLEEQPLATYEGGVRGLKPTKPRSGQRVDSENAAAQEYTDFLRGEQNDAVSAAGARRGDIVRRYDTAFNGMAVELSAAEAASIRKAPGVVNVWEREILAADTVTTPDYLGLRGVGGVWDEQFGGPGNAGDGVIVGIIDSGIWPENPSFAEMDGASVPADWNGACEAGGDNDVDSRVSCNNKLIGARYYKPDGDIPDFEFDSPRDYDGHGSHTAGTAAGNDETSMEVNGVELGVGSGMAPRAQIAAYKALWADGEGGATGTSDDLVAAIDDAVADGVDVINYSVSGSREYVVDAVEIAFLNATSAGVFVATSAGNSGETDGPSSVAHNAPWTTTVAASTHSRNVNKVAPEMAGFSSYGPALAGGGDLLKPDITAPGVDVIAAVAPPAYEGEDYGSLSGTSMSAPHIAGLALLMKQAEPGWSPAAVKSAMMTTARTVNSADEPIQRAGADATPLDYGSGEVVPAPAYEPGLVYDAGFDDWLTYMCAIDQLRLVANPAICDGVDADPSDLNYPTIAIGDLAGSQTVTRTVTNVSDQDAVYSSASSLTPDGVEMEVDPATITVPAGGEATFSVTFQQNDAPLDEYTFGRLVWEPTGGGTSVTSQIALQPTAVSAPDEIVDTGTSGSRDYTLTPGFTGTLDTDIDGMLAPDVTDLTVKRDPNTPLDGITRVEVPSGTSVARFATFADEVAAEDVDLAIYDPSGELVDSSANEGSEEQVTVVDPEPGNWYVTVDLYSKEAQADVPINSFLVGDTDEGNLEVDPTTAAVEPSQEVDMTTAWSGLADGRYLGSINYRNGSDTVGRTLVTITVDDAPTVGRIAGSNRFETAALVAGEYPEGVDTVYVANGYSFADSLSGAPAAASTVAPSTREAAGAVGAPILLTRADRLPPSTIAALEALDPSNVVVLGGEGVVEPSVSEDLEAYGDVERVGGVNRYETSKKIAERSGRDVETVYIASGDERSFPDALGAGALAGTQGAPVLLTRPGRVDEATRSALNYLNPDEVVVIGGPGAVSGTVFTSLGADRRLAGDNRWETAVAISQEFEGDIDGTYVASGEAFPDALAGAALSGYLGQPLTLSAKNSVPAVVMTELDRLSPGEVAMVGGPGALTGKVEERLNASYPSWRR
ncbi:MAG: cell wall-binding repeat-containing protein [Ornithinimicrobium sp.]